jgi:Alw26I/Eco31I/Esp3I family type II restriction m6 adenine DNA methyltransferase
MSAPDEIKLIVENFAEQLDIYKSSNYNETQVRVDYINPMFNCLGWDVENKAGYSEAYRDVIHEDAVKVGGVTKAPDYCFRVGGTRKFFLEAKKPAINIKDDIAPSFQLRRYGWSAKLPLSILTDFEELAVYDCRIKPVKADKASTGRIQYFTFDQYLDNWDEISSIFSKEAILKGSFDKYVESKKRKKGTAEVDDAFLKEIEQWREVLAKNIALRNPALKIRELNFSVQKIIDRIIFLRITEDRRIEDYGRLRGLLNGSRTYARLTDLFVEADKRYNSGLFHFKEEKGRPELPDRLTTGLTIDDKTIKQILKNLYYPESPYEFSVLPADILGQVYERFLGKVIRLTDGHQAKVEDKPEVKKAGGVFYTPTFVVDYIVANTIGKLLDGKTPKQVERLKFLDPACGSGSFMIVAYQYLLDWHLKYYTEHDPEKQARGKAPAIYRHTSGEWRLTGNERKRILLNNIYGVDIDTQAVEVTKLSLLLKVLEGETSETLQTVFSFHKERALPDLSHNIKCGNSLIGPDFYEGQQMSLLDEEEMYRINVFDWQTEFAEIMTSGGFDAVIGNPPYDVLEKDRGNASWPHEFFRNYLDHVNRYDQAKGGKLNLFRFFLIRSYELLAENRYFGMIVPLSLLGDISCKKSRKYLFNNSNQFIADCFPQKDNRNRRIFKDAKLSTTILLTKKSSANNAPNLLIRKYPWNSFEDKYIECKIKVLELNLIDPENIPVPLLDEREWKLCVKIYSNPNIIRFKDAHFIAINRGEINQTIFRSYISSNQSGEKLIKGAEVGRYKTNEKMSQGKKEWFDEAIFLKSSNPKSIVEKKRIATQRITGVDENLRIVATIIYPKTYFADSTNSIIFKSDTKYSLFYILSLMNSKLFQWRFKLTSSNNNVGTNELEAMPLRQIGFSNSIEKAQHDKMVSLVTQMLELNKKLNEVTTAEERKMIERGIAATDNQIDRLVYELYDLTDEEIKIVEGQQ